MTMKKSIKIISLLLIADVLVFLLLVVLIGALQGMFKPSSEKLNMSGIFISGIKIWYVPVLVIIAMDIYILFMLAKNKMFGFRKTLNLSERADSNLYGQAEFMNDKEIKQLFGHTEKVTKYNKKTKQNESSKIKNGIDINWKQLPEEETEGFVIRSYKKNGSLFIDTVSKKNCLVIGTAGTGKSLYYLGPTIQMNACSKNKSSMLINDVKGELFQAHSKLLQDQGYNVICLNLREPRKSTRINILDAIWDTYHKYIDTGDGSYLDLTSQYIVEISTILSPETEGNNKEFGDGAIGILCGIIWGMLEDSVDSKYGFTKDMFTISQISNIINKQSNYMMDFLTHRDAETSKVFDNASMIINNASERTVSSYISTLQTNLRKFLDPGIEYLTATSDFDLDSITEKPTAVFLIIPDESKTRYVLANAIIVQIYNKLVATASKKPNQALERSWYFLLDEFGQMPKIASFPNWIAVCRSRNIYLCPVVQANSQLKSVFGENEAITIQDQCHLKVFLGSNEYATLEYFQKQLGTYTVYSRSASINEKTMSHMEYEGSTSITKKDLVTIDELQYLKSGNIYITIRGEKPIKSVLVPIFDNELRTNHIFILGSIINQLEEKKDPKTFYNLQNRESHFLSGDDTGITNEIINEEIKDETNNFIDNEINVIDDSLLKNLGLIK